MTNERDILALCNTGDARYPGLDTFGRVINQQWLDANNGNGEVDGYQYTYDADGNVLSKVNAFDPSQDETYTYNNLNQLTSYTRNGAGSTYQTFNVDPMGNITSVTTGSLTQNRTTNSLKNPPPPHPRALIHKNRFSYQ